MIIGIDVGGTHADGVLLERGRIIAKNKVGVNHDNLGESIITLLESLLPENRSLLQRIHLSTTLCTNALVNNNLDEVGMFIQAGPGMNPDFLQCGDSMFFLSGAVDHRGQVVQQPDLAEIEAAVTEIKTKNIASIGIVTKFSHRNNQHELLVKDQLSTSFTHISMGHLLSGNPNFPRRVYTTWLNSALKTQFHQFKDAMEDGFKKLGVTCPVYILKADGGTMPFDKGCEHPCQSIHSGPSASVMGALALEKDIDDCVMLDIGGTTTDIALFSQGVPLLEPYGATVSGRPTLIRALLTKSIGLGGDSSVVYENDQFAIGPEKKGAPMAFGGQVPTPTDAMVVLGTIADGSLEKAVKAMLLLCPEQKPEETAAALLRKFADNVAENVEELIDEVFSRPVYTVSAFLDRQKLTPEKLIVIGGPADALQQFLEERFQLECRVPVDYEVANAIGSARARLTAQVSLYADTGLGRLSIPEMSIMEKPGRMFTMMEAEIRLEEALRAMVESMEDGSRVEIDMIEKVEMNTVRGFSSTGKIISLKAQIRPGISPVGG